MRGNDTPLSPPSAPVLEEVKVSRSRSAVAKDLGARGREFESGQIRGENIRIAATLFARLFSVNFYFRRNVRSRRSNLKLLAKKNPVSSTSLSFAAAAVCTS